MKFMNLKKSINPIPSMAVIAFILLFFSGSAFAVYQLWLNPNTVVKNVVQRDNRTDVFLSVDNCNDSKKSIQVEVEDKNIKPQEVSKIISANCESEVIEKWANTVNDSRVMLPYTVNRVNSSQISIGNSSQSHTLEINSKTMIIDMGRQTDSRHLEKGDTVAFITTGSKNELYAVVKLSYNPRYYTNDRYSPEFSNDYHIRHNCAGNTSSSCIDLPSLDLLRDGEASANPSAKGEDREIQGRMIEYNDKQLRLQSTSGEIYNVDTNKNIVSAFNNSNPYGSIKIEKDDVLRIGYVQTDQDNPKEIKTDQYNYIDLLLEGYDKNTNIGELKKYRY